MIYLSWKINEPKSWSVALCNRMKLEENTSQLPTTQNDRWNGARPIIISTTLTNTTGLYNKNIWYNCSQGPKVCRSFIITFQPLIFCKTELWFDNSLTVGRRSSLGLTSEWQTKWLCLDFQLGLTDNKISLDELRSFLTRSRYEPRLQWHFYVSRELMHQKKMITD